MRIVFHGQTALTFHPGFAALVDPAHEIIVLPDLLESDAEREQYRSADVVVCQKLTTATPRPEAARLFQCPGAGYDGIDFSLLAPHTLVANCFGHEDAIAEYVMAGLLMRLLPIAEADRRLRGNTWFPSWAGNPHGMHAEIGGRVLGLLGYGRIGQAVASRARAFNMPIHVANRTRPNPMTGIARCWDLTGLHDFIASCDIIVVGLALTETTRGIFNAAAFAAMRPAAWLVNVARGPVVDEAALYDALNARHIGGAIIDTWYTYPNPPSMHASPSQFPFHTLDNLLMTPHMSGWTNGTIERRKHFIADNITRLARGEAVLNVVRGKEG